uniref:Uncharacterized protein n=1 Tax=Anopheles dirus TaxID=7168 RepID=A0A182NY17_9DIPT
MRTPLSCYYYPLKPPDPVCTHSPGTIDHWKTPLLKSNHRKQNRCATGMH